MVFLLVVSIGALLALCLILIISNRSHDAVTAPAGRSVEGASSSSATQSKTHTPQTITAFINAIQTSSGSYVAEITPAEFVNDPTAPDGYDIVSNSKAAEQLQIASSAALTITGDSLLRLRDAGVLSSTVDTEEAYTIIWNNFAGPYEAAGYVTSSPLLDQFYTLSLDQGTIVQLKQMSLP
jgi:hypothetical protein